MIKHAHLALAVFFQNFFIWTRFDTDLLVLSVDLVPIDIPVRARFDAQLSVSAPLQASGAYIPGLAELGTVNHPSSVAVFAQDALVDKFFVIDWDMT